MNKFIYQLFHEYSDVFVIQNYIYGMSQLLFAVTVTIPFLLLIYGIIIVVRELFK